MTLPSESEEKYLVRLHFCHMPEFAEKLVTALDLQKKVLNTEFIDFYIVWAKGRMAYNEDDSIDSFFFDKQECIAYVKKENDNCRSYSEYYWDDHRIRNPFNPKWCKQEVALQ